MATARNQLLAISLLNSGNTARDHLSSVIPIDDINGVLSANISASYTSEVSNSISSEIISDYRSDLSTSYEIIDNTQYSSGVCG